MYSPSVKILRVFIFIFDYKYIVVPIMSEKVEVSCNNRNSFQVGIYCKIRSVVLIFSAFLNASSSSIVSTIIRPKIFF